jgi:hypothetical protein
LKKLTGSVRFRFYKPEIKKTKIKTKKNRKKTEPNRKNRAKPVFVLKNRTEPKPVGLNQFRLFFFLISVWLLFFDKNRTEPKMITPSPLSLAFKSLKD